MSTGETVQGRLLARLDQASADPALTFFSPRSEHVWSTFGEVFGRAAATAGRLREEGVGAGDAVVIVLPSGEPSARLVLASLLVGARPLLIAPPAILGVNSDLPRVVRNTVRKTSARLVIAASGLAEDYQASRFIFDDQGLAAGSEDEFRPHLPSPESVAAMQLTSGTTGLPRVCVWSQSAVLAAIDGMAAAMNIGAEDMFLNWTPLYHDMGLVNNFLTCMVTGTPLVMMSPHDFVKSPAVWLRALHETGANVTWSPNFGFALAVQRIQDREIEGIRLDHVKGFWNAAERIHLETMLRFRDRFEPYGLMPSALKTNFGCAENIGGATFSDPAESFRYEYVDGDKLARTGRAIPVEDSSAGSVPIVSAGRPHPGIKMFVVSRQGRYLGEGEVGELALDSPSAMNGYLGDAEATSKVLSHGLLKTGDVGYIRDGEFYWTGRSRERITIRGKKFDPSDFERLLFGVGGLRPGCFAAFGVGEAASGTEKLVLVSETVDPLPRTLAEIAAEIRGACLSQHGLNAEVLLVSAGTLTKTSSGKRRHRHFRQMYEAGQLQELALS